MLDTFVDTFQCKQTLHACKYMHNDIHNTFDRARMRHEQRRAQEEEKKRLSEEEFEWKSWMAFWNKVRLMYAYVRIHAHAHCIFINGKAPDTWCALGVQQGPGKEQRRVEKVRKKATSIRLRVKEAGGTMTKMKSVSCEIMCICKGKLLYELALQTSDACACTEI